LRGQPLPFKLFSTLGIHAELNAPSTSKLTINVISHLLNPSWTNSFKDVRMYVCMYVCMYYVYRKVCIFYILFIYSILHYIM